MSVYLVGEHFLFTLIAVLVMLGAFNTIALVMLWAPDAPLMAEYADEPDDRPERA